MTASVSELGSLPPPVPPRAASGRGITRISDGAAARIAQQAAQEVDGVIGAAAGGIATLLPGGSSPSERREVGVKAHVQDEDVTLDVTVAIEFPRPVRATLERLAHHLSGRMSEYAGLRLERLDVSVAELVPPAPPSPRRRVQ